MQQIIAIDQIKGRAEAIGIRLPRLARMAGVHPSTAYRGAGGKVDPRSRTVRKLLATLERAEAQVRAHLKALEGDGGPA